MSADFYDLLEVPEDASQDDIRDAFREKVREYHPDHNDDPRASAQFTAVKKAYDTLGDPVERNAYDRIGHIDYVNKRLDGLPDPDKWSPSGSDDASGSTTRSSSTSTTGSAGGTTATSGSSTGTGSRSSSGSRSSTGSRSSSGAGSSTRSSGSSTSTRTSTGRNGTTSGGRSSSSNQRSGRTGASSGAGARAASDGGATATVSAADYEVDPVVEWISRHDYVQSIVGWSLLWSVFAIYLAGLAGFLYSEQGAVAALTDRVLAAGTDVDALTTALEREAVPIVAEATLLPVLTSPDPETLLLAATTLLVLGSLCVPAVVALLVYVTRTTPGWKPTYLYVVATLGPLAGLVLGLATTPPLAAEIALFVVLPVGAFLAMLLSAFVRPRVLIAIQNARS